MMFVSEIKGKHDKNRCKSSQKKNSGHAIVNKTLHKL